MNDSLVERYKELVCRPEGHEHETRAELLACVLDHLDEPDDQNGSIGDSSSPEGPTPDRTTDDRT